MSLKASYTLTEVTSGDDGQAFGIAHGDYTAAEIEECLETQAAIDAGDKVAQEQASRLVRQIGVMVFNGASSSFNDGKPVKVKLNWDMGIGEALVVWVRNSTGTIYTAGSFIQVNGEIWVTP